MKLCFVLIWGIFLPLLKALVYFCTKFESLDYLIQDFNQEPCYTVCKIGEANQYATAGQRYNFGFRKNSSGY